MSCPYRWTAGTTRERSERHLKEAQNEDRNGC